MTQLEKPRGNPAGRKSSWPTPILDRIDRLLRMSEHTSTEIARIVDVPRGLVDTRKRKLKDQ